MSRAMLTGGEADRGSVGALAESRGIRTRTMHPSPARWSRRGLVGARGDSNRINSIGCRGSNKSKEGRRKEKHRGERKEQRIRTRIKKKYERQRRR